MKDSEKIEEIRLATKKALNGNLSEKERKQVLKFLDDLK